MAGIASRRGYVLLVLTAVSAVNQFDRQLMNLFLEPIRREFALNDVQIGLLVGLAFVAIFTALGIPAALYSVRANRRNLIAAAILCWGAMTLCCGLAQSYWQLFIARFGVGVGEAGGMPPSHAIISDLYPAPERATAMATWAAGINGGLFFSFLFGGIVGHVYGWRVAFVAAGAITLLLSALVRLTVREPVRVRDAAAPPLAKSVPLLMTTLRTLAADAVARHVMIGGMLVSIVGTASLTWLPSFLVRSHRLDVATIGIYLALVAGLGGTAGTWLTGLLSDRLRRRDIRSSLWLIAAVIVATKPFNFGFLLVPSTSVALALFVIPGITAAAFIGPSLAVLHNRVTTEMRPVASALFLLIINFVGFGIGPLLVGVMSQMVFAGYDADALRYSLVVVQFVAIWAAFHFYVAGSHLRPERHDAAVPPTSPQNWTAADK